MCALKISRGEENLRCPDLREGGGVVLNSEDFVLSAQNKISEFSISELKLHAPDDDGIALGNARIAQRLYDALVL